MFREDARAGAHEHQVHRSRQRQKAPGSECDRVRLAFGPKAIVLNITRMSQHQTGVLPATQWPIRDPLPTDGRLGGTLSRPSIPCSFKASGGRAPRA